MNAKKLEKWILLEQTGELSPRRQKILNQCPGVQERRDELKTLFDAVSLSAGEPSPWAATRIHARVQRGHRPVLLSARAWRPILALAACLTLIVTTIDFRSDSSPSSVAAVAVGEVDGWNVQFEEDLAELEGLILAISDTSLDIMEM